jgi:hypothetical protein
MSTRGWIFLGLGILAMLVGIILLVKYLEKRFGKTPPEKRRHQHQAILDESTPGNLE